MNPILWTPTQDQVNASQMEAFRNQVNSRFNIDLKNYFDLYEWSISNISDFWKAVWGFMAIEFSADYKQVVDDDLPRSNQKFSLLQTVITTMGKKLIHLKS